MAFPNRINKQTNKQTNMYIHTYICIKMLKII